MQLSDIGRWIGESFRNPRDTAAAFLKEEWPQGVEWLALAVISVFSAMLNAAGIAALGPSVSLLPVMTPVVYVAVSALTTVVFCFGCYVVGGWLGSNTAFRPLFLIVLWLQFLQVAVQGFSLILTLAMPGMGSLLALILSVWVLWLIVVWLDTAWGWDNRLKSVGAIALTILGVGMLASIVLSVSGVTLMPDMQM